MGEAAVRVAKEMGYTNAGTCEFLLDEDGETFYFLEMNTRLQVEHPVTELITGVDLAQAQLRIAAGDGMGMSQDDVELRGHAIEVRINAEEPASNFVPTPGTIGAFVSPLGPWVRFDTGAAPGYTVPRDYDSMIGKLIVWASDRDGARARMSRALDELVIEGLPTTVPFHRLAMTHPQFAAGDHATSSVEREWDLSSLELQGFGPTDEADPDAGREVTVEVDGRRVAVRLFGDLPAGGSAPAPTAGPRRRRAGSGGGAAVASSEDLVAPMQGTVIEVSVAVDAVVAEGDTLLVLEAMKMENAVKAHRAGVVTSLPVSAGEVVQPGAILARIEDA
ncbi:MAG: biotin/lipoyl-containing protein, partial [Actinomycetota bacterium]